MDGVFEVSCERIARRSSYYIRFSYDQGFIENIKSLPEASRKWKRDVSAWEITAESLFLLIKKYKGSTKIHFNFGNEDSRKIFINQINKIKADEIEKRKFIADLNVKKENWLKYKQELEDNYAEYSDKCHSLLNDGVKLYPHQIIAALFMSATKNTLVSHEMGLGKA